MPFTKYQTPKNDDFFVQGSIGRREIPATPNLTHKPLQVDAQPEKYNGRLRKWPGILLLTLLILTASALIAYEANEHHLSRQKSVKAYNIEQFRRHGIKGGDADGDGIDDIITDDGEIGNPQEYPPSVCEMPNYLSKNGQIIATSSNGTEVPISIKGVNWFGMETGQSIPFGLWDNDTAGTTAYQIAAFLSSNQFNAVRLPVMVDHLLKNSKPNTDMINKFSNQAINVKNYMSLLKSIAKVLAYRKIGVLISIHTLTETDNGGLWYNKDISEDDFLDAIDLLTTNLCDTEYWNVMGLDVKNEPYKASWGTGDADDFRIGAKKITERMLKGCPNWLGFVEGLNYRAHDIKIDGEKFTYNDWYGGGLQDVKEHPIEMETDHKIVWAPHYYTSAVFPQPYFYGDGGTVDPDTFEINDYVELPDSKLKKRVEATMQDMFGYLTDQSPQYAMVLGEFGGLYSKDKHPKKTIQRTVNYTVSVMVENGYAGGFLWSLNPESKYQYIAADTGSRVATYEEGLLELDWLTANGPYLAAMTPMNELPNLQKLPCFPKK